MISGRQDLCHQVISREKGCSTGSYLKVFKLGHNAFPVAATRRSVRELMRQITLANNDKGTCLHTSANLLVSVTKRGKPPERLCSATRFSA